MSRIPGLIACHMHGMDKTLFKAFLSDVSHMSVVIHVHPAHLT